MLDRIEIDRCRKFDIHHSLMLRLVVKSLRTCLAST